MATKVQTIIDNQIRTILRDTDAGGVQWKDAEVVSWFNEACGEVARIRPEASSKTETVANTLGSKQTVGVEATMLLEVVCAGTDGRAIRPVERQILDAEDPNWRAAASTASPFRYVVSLTDPRTYYLYPPASAGTHTRVVGTVPTTITDAVNQDFPLPEIYVSPVVNWVLFRCYSKLTENANAKVIAADHLALFNNQMGITDSRFEGRNAKIRHPEKA